jgi:hypothetical protein
MKKLLLSIFGLLSLSSTRRGGGVSNSALLFSIFILLLLSSWKADTKGPWIKTEGKRIVLYSRPLHYSDAASPDTATTMKIIREQESVIDYINNRLNTDFNDKVSIYLFNLDEAKQKMGTNSGGFASLSKFKNAIYFTYREQPILNPVFNIWYYVGIHEMVHVITKARFGQLTTSFFGEGYSNALDGCYGARIINDQLVFRRNDSTVVAIQKSGKLLTPTELLYNKELPERAFYPQIGCLVHWLFESYGVEKINRLFGVKKDRMEEEFLKVTGEEFLEMQKKYMMIYGR